jgi:ribulose-5-phosphate 4-epimerase/fuculose-1-phosphate aldolase
MTSIAKRINQFRSRSLSRLQRFLDVLLALATIALSAVGRPGGIHLHSRHSITGSIFIPDHGAQYSAGISKNPPHLFGINSWLDDQLGELGLFASLNRSFHAGSQGDVSLFLPRQVGDLLVERFAETATAYYPFHRLHEIVELRKDGRQGYYGMGVNDQRLLELCRGLKRRVLIVTATDVSIPAIKDYMEGGIGGRGIVAMQISPLGDGFRILYGNAEWGTLPSSETLIHIASAAIMAQRGQDSGTMVHCHPFPIVRLALNPKLLDGEHCDPKKLNAALLRIQSWLFQGQESTVTVVPIPYQDPGSGALVRATLDVLPSSPFVLWENHGTVVRAPFISGAYGMTASVSCAAEAGLNSLEQKHGGFPMSRDLYQLLRQKELLIPYETLFGVIDHEKFAMC